jgi:hypothetical protein
MSVIEARLTNETKRTLTLERLAVLPTEGLSVRDLNGRARQQDQAPGAVLSLNTPCRPRSSHSYLFQLLDQAPSAQVQPPLSLGSLSLVSQCGPLLGWRCECRAALYFMERAAGRDRSVGWFSPRSLLDHLGR